MRNRRAVEVKHHISKHLPAIPVFFNEPPDLTGFTEGKPGVGKRIVAIRSVLYSDGSARRWYRMAVVKKKTISAREKRVKKK